MPKIEEKRKLVDELVGQFDKYRTIGVASLHRVRADQLNELRKQLRADVLFRVVKNTLMTRAIKRSKKTNLDKLVDLVKDSNVLLCTNMDPFELVILLKKSAIRARARVGDVLEEDILIRAGNTGLPPGPVISELDAAGIPTRIESGSVWVVRDTVVAEKGDAVSEQLATALSRLGIKPMKFSLTPTAMYDDGMILSSEVLSIDVDVYIDNVRLASQQAMMVAFEAVYITKETISPLIQKAVREVRSVALNVAYPSPEVLPELLRRAHGVAQVLATRYPSEVKK